MKRISRADMHRGWAMKSIDGIQIWYDKLEDCHCEELEAFVKYVKNNVHNANKTQTIYNKARQLRGEL